MKNTDNYQDIINLPHHVSKKHKQMSLYDRAAQFAPFAALNGYEDAIEDMAEVTKEIALSAEKGVAIDENGEEL